MFKKSACILLGLAFSSTVAFAQDKKIETKQLSTLTKSDRTQIESILKKSRLMKENASLQSDADLKGFLGLPDITLPIPDIRIQACKAACDVAAVSAASACTGLSSGTAVAVCTAAAFAAGESCKNGC